MLETMLRRYVQPFIHPIAHVIGPCPPIYVTLASCILGCGCAMSIAYGYMTPAIILLWSSGLCDMLDGTIARTYGISSARGAYLDLIADRSVEGAIALGIATAFPDTAWHTTLFISSVLLHFSTFALAATFFPNQGEKGVHYEASVIERSEAFVVITILLLFPCYRHMLLHGLSLAIILVSLMRIARIFPKIEERA